MKKLSMIVLLLTMTNIGLTMPENEDHSADSFAAKNIKRLKCLLDTSENPSYDHFWQADRFNHHYLQVKCAMIGLTDIDNDDEENLENE